jgi:nitroreductase
MKRLGEILLERGAIAIAELHTGLEACHYSGGRLGTQLLKFGFVDEHALLEALSEQLGVPSVASAILRRAPDSLRRMIPLHVSRRVQVVVFDKKEGILGVAMTTPRSPSAIEEVVSYLGLDIKPHVATEVGILTALAEIREEEPTTAKPPKPQAGFVGSKDEWDRLWAPPKLRSADLLRVGRGQVGGKAQIASTFPGLAPVPESSRPLAGGPLDDEIYRQLLREVQHREEVGDLLLRRSTAVLHRCYLLAVHSGKVVGWQAKGAGVVIDDVQSFAFQQDAPSVLSKVQGLEGYWGPPPPGEINDALKQILGDPEPVEFGVFPVLVKNRVVAYLVGDAPGKIVSETDRKKLVDAVQKAGLAFEILIMRKKILA